MFKNPGFKSPWGRVKSFAIFLFFFTFFILFIKNWISKHKLFFLYINRSHRNKIKFVQHTYFYWFLSDKRRYKRTFYSVSYGEYENEKKKGQKHLTFPTGIWTPDFVTNSRPLFEFWREIRSIEVVEIKISRL